MVVPINIGISFHSKCGVLKLLFLFIFFLLGELAEWLNAAVLKTVKDASPSGVRIPDSPHTINGLR